MISISIPIERYEELIAKEKAYDAKREEIQRGGYATKLEEALFMAETSAKYTIKEE